MKPDKPDDLTITTDQFMQSIDKMIDQVIADAPRSKRSAALIACICTLEDLEPADQQAVAETLTAFYVFNRQPAADPRPRQSLTEQLCGALCPTCGIPAKQCDCLPAEEAKPE